MVFRTVRDQKGKGCVQPAGSDPEARVVEALRVGLRHNHHAIEAVLRVLKVATGKLGGQTQISTV